MVILNQPFVLRAEQIKWKLIITILIKNKIQYLHCTLEVRQTFPSQQYFPCWPPVWLVTFQSVLSFQGFVFQTNVYSKKSTFLGTWEAPYDLVPWQAIVENVRIGRKWGNRVKVRTNRGTNNYLAYISIYLLYGYLNRLDQLNRLVVTIK